MSGVASRAYSKDSNRLVFPTRPAPSSLSLRCEQSERPGGPSFAVCRHMCPTRGSSSQTPEFRKTGRARSPRGSARRWLLGTIGLWTIISACTGSMGGGSSFSGSPGAADGPGHWRPDQTPSGDPLAPDGSTGPASDGGPPTPGSTGEGPSLCQQWSGPGSGWQSAVVRYDSSKRLQYQEDGDRNRMPDFGHAGYRNGEAPLPRVATVLEISPESGDNTDHIQQALDEVGRLPLDEQGFRGALLLRAGEYRVEGTIRLSSSGVVLRGAGDGEDSTQDTILVGVGDTPHQRDLLVVGSGQDDKWQREVDQTRVEVTSDFVPVGSQELEVEDASRLRVGDNVVIVHPSTQRWLERLEGGGAVDESPWSEGDIDLVFNRFVTAVAGNRVTLDVPLFNHLDRDLATSFLYVHDRGYLVTNVGVENLRVDVETDGNTDENHVWNTIALVGVEDAWVADVTTLHFGHSGVIVRTGTRITVAQTRALDPVARVEGGRMYNFDASPGQQVLFTRCEASNGRHHFISNGTSSTSGVVFHRCTSRGAYASSEGHRRWSMGLLYDNVRETEIRDPGRTLLGLYNRGDYGTSHGWGAVHSVAWNTDMGQGRAIIQQPPTAQNYAIGGQGEFTGQQPPAPFPGAQGYIEGVGRENLVPESLYEAQLIDRLCF